MISLFCEIELENGQLFKIDKRNIISSNNSIQDRVDVENPVFGLISNEAEISFRDTQKDFLYNYNSNNVRVGSAVKCFIYNTISKQKNQTGYYYIDNVDYDSINETVSLELSDGLQRLQEVELEEYYSEYAKSAKEIFESITSQTNFNNKIEYSGEEITIEIPKLNSGSAWSQIDKLLKAIRRCGYVDEYGKLVIKPMFSGI